MIGHEEYHRRLSEIAEAATDAVMGQGKYKGTRFGEHGHIALYLLAELTKLMVEQAQDEIPDGK